MVEPMSETPEPTGSPAGNPPSGSDPTDGGASAASQPTGPKSKSPTRRGSERNLKKVTAAAIAVVATLAASGAAVAVNLGSTEPPLDPTAGQLTANPSATSELRPSGGSTAVDDGAGSSTDLPAIGAGAGSATTICEDSDHDEADRDDDRCDEVDDRDDHDDRTDDHRDDDDHDDDDHPHDGSHDDD